MMQSPSNTAHQDDYGSESGSTLGGWLKLKDPFFTASPV